MPKAAYKPKRVAPGYKIDTPCAERGRAIEPLFSLFRCLVSLREELRARKDIVERAKPLPIYVERDPNNGNLFFRSCPGSRKRVLLPSDPTTAEFDRAYRDALVDAGEADSDDWSELKAFHAGQLEEMHRAQRPGKAGSSSR
jgi:hypothetical protein